jgi:hypothetical protein
MNIYFILLTLGIRRRWRSLLHRPLVDAAPFTVGPRIQSPCLSLRPLLATTARPNSHVFPLRFLGSLEFEGGPLELGQVGLVSLFTGFCLGHSEKGTSKSSD